MSALLVYFVCAISAPGQCERHAVSTPSYTVCVTGAQAALAGPLAVEGWRVRDWRCEGAA